MTQRISMLRPLLCQIMLLGALVLAAHAQSQGDFDRGLSELRAGNYGAAATSFARAEAAAPGSTEALLYESKSFIHLQDFPAAEKAVRAYLDAHAEAADALYLLGFILHRENRPAESLQFYTRAAAHTRPTGDDLKIVGLNYVLLNDYADAIHWLEKAVEFEPKNIDAWYYLGRAYYTRARLKEARRAFLTVLDLDPQNVRAESNLGLIFESDAQPEAAIAAYRKAIAWQEQSLHPSEQPYVNLGNLLIEQGQTREAITPLERAVVLAPNNAFCHIALGMAYRESGELEAARRELEKGTQLEPDNAKAHYQLGRLYKDTHDLNRAQAEFRRTDELKARAAGSVMPPHNP
jgi:tetratricopeptide (TPR) repeat protein